MSPSKTLLLAACAGLALSACGRQNDTRVQNAAENAGSDAARAANQIGDSPPVNAAQDATAAAVGATSAATVGSFDTGAFVSNAVESNEYEIQAAKIAQERGSGAGVKAFAAEMIKDHTRLGNEMKPVLDKLNMPPPKELDDRRKGLLDNLRTTPAADFDRTYIDQQVSAHQEALTLMKGYADHGDNAELKALAAKAAPVIQHHLDEAQKLQAAAGGR